MVWDLLMYTYTTYYGGIYGNSKVLKEVVEEDEEE